MADNNKNKNLTEEQHAYFQASIAAYVAGIKHYSTIAVAEEEGAKRGKSEARKAVYGPLKERLETEFARIHEEFQRRHVDAIPGLGPEAFRAEAKASK